MKVNTGKGCVVLSVSVEKGCYRHIKVPMNKKLTYLADYILDCFEFSHDHLYSFFMNNRLWDQSEEYAYRPEEPYVYDAARYKLSELGLEKGKQFKFLFDYGDEWEFQCKVLRIETSNDKEASLIKSVGEAPEQYGWYDEDEDEYEDFDEDDEEFDEELLLRGIMETEQKSEPESNLYDMISDELLVSAIEFYKKAGTRKSYYTQPFALKLSNGETAYCIYSTDDDISSLRVHVGDNGWKMYSRCYQLDDNYFDEADFPDGADALCCYFASKKNFAEYDYNCIKERTKKLGYSVKKYPIFTYKKTFYIPWQIESEEHVTFFTEALNAARYVFSSYSKFKNQLSNGMMYGRILYLIPDGAGGYTSDEINIPPHVEYPSPSVKTKKLPQQGKWVCDICATPTGIGEDCDIPYSLKALVVLRTDKNADFNPKTFEPETSYEEIIQYMADEFERLGYYPETIAVRNDRTESLISSFCSKAKIKTERKENIPALSETLDKLFEDSIETLTGAELREAIIAENPEFEMMLDFMEKLILESSVSELKKTFDENSDEIKEMYKNNLFSAKVQKKLSRIFG